MAAESDAIAGEAELRARYEAAGQGHVFKFVDEGKVDDAGKAELFKQLAAIDLDFVNSLFRDTMAGAAAGSGGELEPMEGVITLASAPAEDKARWFERGLQAVAAGEVAALVLAGGQGSRLGFDRPKGEYDLNLPSHKTLFKIMSDRIKRVRALAAKLAGKEFGEVRLPWFIMTSPMTHEATQSYFEENKNFDLGDEEVTFFSQGTLPCMTNEGKIMLETGSHVAEAPDGNGGIYRALHLSGSVARMEERGVKYVHAFAVDNAVCKVADPSWIGYCIEQKADMGCKVLAKASPDEKVGVLCRKGGKFAVVEYSDLDETSMNARNEDGSLTFSAGNICIHFYTLDFLKTKCSPAALPKEYHIARKKIPYANPEDGTTVPKSSLKENNGIKLESFIFDVCALSDAMAALDVIRNEEFSPVKNAEGSDSPATARQIFSDLSIARLRAAGATVGEGKAPEGVANVAEVSGLVSYGGEGLEAFAGMEMATPLLVQAESEAAEEDLAGEGPVRVTTKGGVTVYTVIGV